MPKSSQHLVDYENPPVIEVVCGVMFKPIVGFMAPHFGLAWEKFRDEYPECKEAPPLDPVIEVFGESRKITLELGPLPPLPRVWLIHKDDNKVVQLQKDRFLFNWRKAKEQESYPRYRSVKREFKTHFQKYVNFLKESRLGHIEPLQYEMTYINHIPQGLGWETLNDIGSIFPDFAFRAKEGRFLPVPDSIEWRTSFLLPNRAGRMHALIRNVTLKDSQKEIVLLELTVRGIDADRTTDSMWKWFDLAREWIVKGFTDLTGEEIQSQVWRRKK